MPDGCRRVHSSRFPGRLSSRTLQDPGVLGPRRTGEQARDQRATASMAAERKIRDPCLVILPWGESNRRTSPISARRRRRIRCLSRRWLGPRSSLGRLCRSTAIGLIDLGQMPPSAEGGGPARTGECRSFTDRADGSEWRTRPRVSPGGRMWMRFLAPTGSWVPPEAVPAGSQRRNPLDGLTLTRYLPRVGRGCREPWPPPLPESHWRSRSTRWDATGWPPVGVPL